jgi:hypothetical protein
VDWTIYGALVVVFLALVAALVFLAVRVLQTWRVFKRFRRHAVKELDRLTVLADAAAVKAERAGDERLAASLERLRAGLAQLSVLRSALDEVGDTFARLTAVYPRKRIAAAYERR